MRDPLGNETHYVYDGNGRLIEVRSPMSNTGRFVYDLDGRLTTVTDAENNIIRYEHNCNGLITRIIYPDGTYTSFIYDAASRLIQTIDPQGGIIRYEYNEAGRLIQVTDQLGHIWQYSHDPMGRIASMTDPMGGTTRFEYDLNGNLIREINPMGYETLLTYDALNRLIAVQDPRGNITHLAYDADDNLTRITNADGGMLSYHFDGNNRMTSMTRHLDDGTQATTVLAYDPAGNLVRITDPLGNTTIFGYDALNRNIYTNHPDGGRDEFTFDADGRISQVRRRVSTGEYNTTTYHYDRNGRLTSITDAQGNSISFVYDGLGRVVQEIDQAGNINRFAYNPNGQLVRFTDAQGNITEFGYDAAGRLIWESVPRANYYFPREKTQYIHDANGRITAMVDPMGRRTSFTHDALGRILTVTDALGNITTYEYDANGNIIRTIDTYNNESIFTYDEMNRLVTVQLTGQTEATIYTHNTRGLVTRRVGPTSGTELIVYDAKGNIISRTDPNGNITTYEHDPMGRVTRMNFADGTQANFAFNYAGQLVAMEDWTGTTTFENDILGRLVTVTDPNGREVTYTWDERSNRTSVTVTGHATDTDTSGNPITSTTSYTFDSLNRVATMTDNSGTRTTYRYFPTGLLHSFESTNGESGTYTYDATGNRLTAEYSFNTSPRRAYAWTYDQLGRVISETRDNIGIGIFPTIRHSLGYRYDGLGRLIRYYNHEGSITNFTYDPSGNMLTSSITRNNQTETTRFIYNNRGQLTSQITPEATHNFTYDAAGNLIRETRNGETIRELSYNAQNRFYHGINETGETTTYTFNALGYRVAWETTSINPNQAHQSNQPGQSASEHFTTPSDLLNELTIEAGITTPDPDLSTWFDIAATTRQAEIFTHRREYVPDFTSNFPSDLMIITPEYTHILEYAPGFLTNLHAVTTIITAGITADQEAQETQNTIIAATRPKLYARTNRLGSIAYFICETEGILQSYNEHDPWGNLYTPRATNQNFAGGLTIGLTGYTGFAHDYVLDLYFAHFRLYDPQTMRFNAPDPVRGNIVNPQTLNLYTYVLNSPTNLVDPWGLTPEAVHEAAQALLAARGKANDKYSTVDTTSQAYQNRNNDIGARDIFQRTRDSSSPPCSWDDMVNEVRHHHPGMKEGLATQFASRIISMLSVSSRDFRANARQSMFPPHQFLA